MSPKTLHHNGTDTGIDEDLSREIAGRVGEAVIDGMNEAEGTGSDEIIVRAPDVSDIQDEHEARLRERGVDVQEIRDKEQAEKDVALDPVEPFEFDDFDR